jgi:signal transduction histidine kinase
VNLETDLVAHQGRRYAVVQVQDHGIGMTPEQLEKAFDRFYRADTSGNIPGTGLGLSLVKEIADLHQGRVEMSSEFGKGTRVSLWIPLSA